MTTPPSPAPRRQRQDTTGASLRLLLIWAFLLPLLAGVGLTGFLLIRNSRHGVDQLTAQLRWEIADRVAAYLDGFLETPHRLNQLNAELLESGQLDPRDAEALGRHFFLQLRHSDALSFIFFGTAAGGAAGAGHNSDGVLVVDTTDVDPQLGPVAGTRYEYRALAGGGRGPLIQATEGFDARRRPWFRSAVEARGPVWSDVYPFFAERTLALAASRPVFDAGGELLGVLGVDLALAEVGEYLAGLEVGKTGLTFVVERSGYLIASSSGEEPYQQADDDDPARLAAAEAGEPLVAATTRFLERRFGDLAVIRTDRQIDFNLNGERQLVDVLPLVDRYGLDWLIVVVVPEKDFIGAVAASTRTTLWLCAAALVLAVALGLATANYISHPVQRLTGAAQAIAGGKLDHRVEPGGIEELDRLAQSFNRMAAQLKRSFDELEERVRQRTAELRDAKEAAEAANRAKTDFLSTVSHELRTPLSAILGYADLLADGLADINGRPEADLYLRTIRDNAEQLRELVSDLLDINRIEAGKLQLDPHPCALEDVLAQLESAFRPRAEQKGLAFEVVTDESVPWRFVADPLRLRQILSNLLSNAILYTHEGTVTLRVGTAGGAREAGGADRTSLVFRVEDTGPGISASDQARLFQRFDRLGQSDREGFGLGLAITRQLTELMGGSVSLDSREGEGSTFTVEVPVVECSRWDVRSGQRWHRPPPAAEPHRRQPLRGRALVADDSRALRELCEHSLRRWGLECRTVANGRDAIAEAVDRPYDVLLMDWQMPEADGLQATEELRRRGVETPIIAFTAAAMPADRRRCLDAGCDAYLVKPLDFGELHRLLSRFLPPADGGKPLVRKQSADDDAVELVRRYVDGLPAQADALRQSLARGDWRRFDDVLHRLAGTAGSYGLTAVFEAAESLEDAALERDRDRCRPLLDRLDAAVEESRRRV